MVNLNELNRLKNEIYNQISDAINEMRREGETDFYNPLEEYYDASNSIKSLMRIEHKLNVEISDLKNKVDELEKELLHKSSNTEASEKFSKIIENKEQELEKLNKDHTEMCNFFIETNQENYRLRKELEEKKRELENTKIQHQTRIFNLFQTLITNLAKSEDKSKIIAKLILKNYRVVKSKTPLPIYPVSEEHRSGAVRLFKYKLEKQNKQDYDFLKKNLKEVKTLHNELEKTTENKNIIIGQQWGKINILTKDSKEKRKIIDRLTVSLGAEQKKKQKLESEKEELKKFISEKEKVIGKLTRKLKTTTNKSTRSKQYQENRAANLTNKMSKLKSQNNALQGQMNYWQSQDDLLHNTIKDLQAQITQLQKEKKSLAKQKGTAQQQAQQLRKDFRANHKSWQEKYELLEQENIQLTDLTDNKENLEQSLLRKIGRLTSERAKNQKLTKTKRVKAILAEKLRTDLKELEQASERLLNAYQEKDQEATQLQTDLNQTQTDLNTLLAHRYDLYLQLAQFNGELSNKQTTIQSLQSANQQLEQEKIDLNNQLINKDSLITNLNAEKEQNQQKIRELIDNYQQEQKEYQESKEQVIKQTQKIKKQQKSIQRLETEKQNWQQREKQLLAKQKQLLTEIELLKNPPQQANKENIQVETSQYQEQVKALVQKLPVEQIKTINLILQEQQNKFNQQLQAKETQISLLDKSKQRERERERQNLLRSDFTFNSHCIYFVDSGKKEEIRR